jgi:RNA polymerase sigma-70 factor (ECF subfamily)
MLTLTETPDARDRPAMKRDRDEAAFLARLDRHQGIVRKVALSYARTTADRRDLEQEIVAQLWKSWPAWDGERPFATWMYRVALNVAISIARSQRWQEPALAPLDDETAGLPADPGDAEREHGVAELRTFIAGLDELNRALILLWLDELSYREIADVLGISETNVATRINRAKQTLRARMNPAGE